MSDQLAAQLSMKEAMVNQLQNEVAQLQGSIKRHMAHNQSLTQCVQEYLTANINMRSCLLLSEEDANRFKAEVKQYLERIETLEKENKELREKSENNLSEAA